MRFRGQTYTYQRPHMAALHKWEIRGPRGGVHFHVSIMDDPKYNMSETCGLEFHHAFDPTGGQQAPHHIDCPVTGGQCWHDGTSLYAEESLWPLIKHWLSDGQHEQVFRLLEGEYDRHFANFERAASS